MKEEILIIVHEYYDLCDRLEEFWGRSPDKIVETENDHQSIWHFETNFITVRCPGELTNYQVEALQPDYIYLDNDLYNGKEHDKFMAHAKKGVLNAAYIYYMLDKKGTK